MVEWQRFDPAALFPSDMADLLAATAPLAELLGSALDIMADVVDVAALFVQGFVDAQAALISGVQDAIDAVTQQLLTTGIYYEIHMPQSYSGRMGLPTWVSDVAYSFDDHHDPERPILVDPSAYVGVISVVAVGSTYKGLLSDYRGMFETFGKRIAEAAQIDRWPEREDPWVTVPGIGWAPNWASKRLADIVPPIAAIAKAFNAFASSVTGAAGSSDIYSAYADQLREKAALLIAFSEQMLAILNQLESLLSWEGAYVLPIYGQGDSEWVQQQLTSARGGPWDVEGVEFTAGAVFLATGGTSAPVDALFDLFGIAKEVTG